MERLRNMFKATRLVSGKGRTQTLVQIRSHYAKSTLSFNFSLNNDFLRIFLAVPLL